MPGTVAIVKVLGGFEDLTFGMEVETQLRNDVEYVIQQINAGHIPYSEAESITNALNNIFAILGMGGPENPVLSIYRFGGQLTLSEILLLPIIGNVNVSYMSTTTGVLTNGSSVAIDDYIASNGVDWFNIGNLSGIKGDTGDTGATGATGATGPAPVQSGFAGYFLHTDGSDLTDPTWQEVVTPTNYATSIKGGTVKMRIDGNNMYITNDGTDA